MVILIIVIIILIIIASLIISTYNKLIKLKNKIKNSWGHIEVQLQRRFDLIPNLVEIVKGFAEHEKELLDNVDSIKNQYMNAHTNDEKLKMDSQLNACIKVLFNISENNPRMKTSAQFLQLQSALTEIEEDLSYARQFYNDAVTIYNNNLMSFPNNIVASMFNFKEESVFNASKTAEMAPKIRFNKIHKCPICGATITNENSDNCEYCGCSLY